MNGSFINHLIASGAPKAPPAVGDPATVIFYSDRHAATVIKVTPKTVTVQRDRAKRTDKNGMSDCQSYDYERNPEGETETFRLTKRGWRHGSTRAAFGYREEYHDYSF